MFYDCLIVKLATTVMALYQTTHFTIFIWLFCILIPGTGISWRIILIALICWGFVSLLRRFLLLWLSRFVWYLFRLRHRLLDLSRRQFFFFRLILPFLLLHTERLLCLFGVEDFAVVFVLVRGFFRIKHLLLCRSWWFWHMLEIGSRRKSSSSRLRITVKWLVTRSHSLFQ